MAKPKLSAADAAAEIQRLCDNEGMTHAQIKANHPELNDGWTYGIATATATRAPRGGGPSSLKRPVAALP